MTDWPLPPDDGLIVAWYGDDFTGSAATMEVLAFAGFPAAMFLAPPATADIARFPGLRAIGIAGDARTRPPEWMDAHLPDIFAALRATGARIVHHKVCSTMDSAPQVGSIGRAAEIGLATGGWAPLVLAAPGIARWQAFGNIFARAPQGVVRLDRHPTMSVHPVTPMAEADVRRHLALQTDLPLGLVDLLALKSRSGALALQSERAAGARIVAFDVVDDETLAETGRLLWAEAEAGQIFAIGSQGVEYALAAAFARGGHRPPVVPDAAPVRQTAIVSGSCSPDTARQVATALSQGFAALAIDASTARDPVRWQAELARAEAAAMAVLAQGQSPILHTALGPDDPRIAAVRAAAPEPQVIGAGLGRLVSRIAVRAGLQRIGIAGGDTSSHAVAALGFLALTAEARIAPGAPLLAGHAADPATAPVELVLKGGQMGRDDFFARMRDGPGGA